MTSFVSWLPGDSGFGDSCGHMKSVSLSWEQLPHSGWYRGDTKGTQGFSAGFAPAPLGDPVIPIFLH